MRMMRKGRNNANARTNARRRKGEGGQAPNGVFGNLASSRPRKGVNGGDRLPVATLGTSRLRKGRLRGDGTELRPPPSPSGFISGTLWFPVSHHPLLRKHLKKRFAAFNTSFLSETENAMQVDTAKIYRTVRCVWKNSIPRLQCRVR